MRPLLICALAACTAAPRTPVAPAPPVVVLVAATAEWDAVIALEHPARVERSPAGAWFDDRDGTRFLHAGYGKVASAAGTAYAIATWHPALLVNLGTAGGFADAKVGDVVLVERSVIYDLVERMGDPDETIADYATTIDTSRWPARLAARVHAGPIVSGDQDLDPARVDDLHARYHASAGDWESGAIAWVAARYGTPVVILRAVTDVVTRGGDPTYANEAAWRAATRTAMATLLALFRDARPDLLRSR